MTQPDPDTVPVRVPDVQHEVVVAAPPERAFDAFLALDRIKPREHNLLPVPIEETVLEPRVGGAVYDRGVDGSTCRWARVLAFDPPHRLVLSWDIGPDWRVHDDLAHASEVEVTFAPHGDSATRVTLVHRHLDRHGEGGAAVREGVDGEGGWPLYLQRYAAVVTGGAA